MKEAETGIPVKELCRKHGMATASLYAWKRKFGGMEISDAKRLCGLESNRSRSCAACQSTPIVGQPP